MESYDGIHLVLHHAVSTKLSGGTSTKLTDALPHPIPPTLGSGVDLQVWISLQTSTGGRLSETLTGTAPEFLDKIALMSTTSKNAGIAAGSTVENPSLSSGVAELTAHTPHDETRLEQEADVSGIGGGVGEVVLDVLCTGSLYTVAAALEAFGAQVGE